MLTQREVWAAENVASQFACFGAPLRGALDRLSAEQLRVLAFLLPPSQREVLQQCLRQETVRLLAEGFAQRWADEARLEELQEELLEDLL